MCLKAVCPRVREQNTLWRQVRGMGYHVVHWGPEPASLSKQGPLNDLSHAPPPKPSLLGYPLATDQRICLQRLCQVGKLYNKVKCEEFNRGAGPTGSSCCSCSCLFSACLLVCVPAGPELGGRQGACQMSITPGKANRKAGLTWSGSVPLVT